MAVRETRGVRGYGALQEELISARSNLADCDLTIRKVTGRDAREVILQGKDRRRSANFGRPEVGTFNRNRLGGRLDDFDGRNNGAPLRRVSVDNMNRVARETAIDEEDQQFRKGVQSAVVSQPRKRIASSAFGAGADTKGKERNKRMFGALMGTLRQFKDDRSNEEHVERRKRLEQKLERKFEDEKNQRIKEKHDLLSSRRANIERIRRLERKMAMVRMFEQWAEEHRKLGCFIRTTTGKRPIYYMPKGRQLVNKQSEKLADTAAAIESEIAVKRQRLEDDLEKLLQPGDEDGERPSKAASHNNSGSESSEDDDDDHDVDDKTGDGRDSDDDNKQAETRRKKETRSHSDQTASSAKAAHESESEEGEYRDGNEPITAAEKIEPMRMDDGEPIKAMGSEKEEDGGEDVTTSGELVATEDGKMKEADIGELQADTSAGISAAMPDDQSIMDTSEGGV